MDDEVRENPPRQADGADSVPPSQPSLPGGQRRLEQVLDALLMFVGLMGADGRLRYVNEKPLQLAGIRREDIIGRPLADTPWFAHSDTERTRVRDALQRAAAGEIVHENFTITTAGGDLRTIDAIISPLRDGSAAIEELVGSAVDVTERQQQRARVQRLTQILRLQSSINAAVVRIRDRSELLREACRLAVDCGGYHNAALWSVESDGRSARLMFRAGGQGIELPAQITISDGSDPDDSLTSRALRTALLCMSDLKRSEPPVGGRAQLLAFGYQSLTALPLVVAGKAVAALSLASLDRNQIDDEHVALLQDIGATLSFALHSHHLQHVAEFLQCFDPLTGLAGRTVFVERLERIIGADNTLPTDRAVVTFDVRRLTHINDSLGRHAGDALLQAVAERLKRGAEGEAHAAYLGSGTFALLVPGAQSSEESIMALLEETVFSEPFLLDGRSIRTACRIGLARYPQDARHGAPLLEYAEAALKRAKDRGEPYQHYQLAISGELAEQLLLEHQLREALDSAQFIVFYQPQVDTRSGTIIGLEALLRWRHPEFGIVPPDRFLPVLESTGLIVPVGEWVIQRAIEDTHRWHACGISPLRVAVNVAPVQLTLRRLVHNVLDSVTGIATEWALDLEITESSFLHDVHGANRDLSELRRAGVRVALDDFGTGYSSLGLLSRLQVDTLKIDRSFIAGLPQDARSVTLVSSLVAIASASQLTVVAEGVETQAQFDLLRNMGCHQTQGYLHARPAPFDPISAILPRCAAGNT